MKHLLFSFLIILFLARPAFSHDAMSHENDKHPRSFLNYRGQRLSPNMNHGPKNFKLVGIRTSSPDGGKLTVDLIFSSGIDPRTMDNTCILINGKPLSPMTMFFFNKRGNIIRFELTDFREPFSIQIQNITSFNGIKMFPFTLENITGNMDFRIPKEI